MIYVFSCVVGEGLGVVVHNEKWSPACCVVDCQYLVLGCLLPSSVATGGVSLSVMVSAYLSGGAVECWKCNLSHLGREENI